MLEMYAKEQEKWENNQKIQEIKVKDQEQEEEWMIHKYWNSMRKEGEGTSRKPDYKENGINKINDDKHICR